MGRVAVVQMVSSADLTSNLESLLGCFEHAAKQGVELLVLPENFAMMGYADTDKYGIAEVMGEGRIQQWISHLAQTFGLWVIAGTIPLQGRDHRVCASSLVFDAQGLCVARYDKIHLFDVQVSDEETHQESNTIAPGSSVVVVDTPVGRVGLSVCYDVRFPELYHQMLKQGAEIFTVVSAFTSVTGQAHWDILLRARAIENVAYVLAPNQGGLHENGRSTYGHSMIIDPWGTVLGCASSGPSMIVADLDLEHLRALRKRLPCHQHHVLTDKS